MRGGFLPAAMTAALLAAFLVVTAAEAQMVGPRDAPRAQLESMLETLRTELQETRDRDRQRQLARDVAALEHRLDYGDLYPRDVIVLGIDGQEEWSGEFPVGPQQELELPRIDAIPLEGVLYSELENHLHETLGQYLRNPRIRAQALKRVAVLGEVGSPGFYNLPGSMMVSEAIMRAGGPTRDANLEKTEIRSFGVRLASDRRHLPAQGVSLDRLGISSGDEIFVPRKSSFNIRNVAWGIGATASLVALLTRIF